MTRSGAAVRQGPAFVPVVLVGLLALAAVTRAGTGDARWLAQVQRDIAAAEYDVTWQDGTPVAGLPAAWHAPNREQGFRTYFGEDGIRLVPRAEVDPVWLLGLDPIRLGRPWLSTAVEPARPSAADNRIDYQRGALLERFVNKPLGLTIGFRLSEPPGGPVTWRDSGARLELDLEIVGGLSPRIDRDGSTADFVDERGVRVLRYSRIVARDATGRDLSARVEGFDGQGPRGLRLAVDDRDAVYPVTIDALIESPVWSAEGGQIEARFGVAVGTAGDVNGDGISDVIVGANEFDKGQFDEGRAFLYLGTPAGPSFVAAWTAEGDQDLAGFGIAVGTAGDVNGDGFSDVIVGASGLDGAQPGAGAAFVFLGSPVGLSATPAWTAQGVQSSEDFGRALGTAGDVNGDGFSDVIVGARGFANGDAGEGRALVYLGSSSGLGTTAAWQFEGDQADARLGEAVGTAGDVDGDGYGDIIVGAPGHDADHLDEGRTRVFLGSASGPATTPSWMIDGGQEGAASGSAVAPAGDINGDGFADVLVGAPSYDAPAVDAGRAALYRGGLTGLHSVASWVLDGQQAEARLGWALFAAGDVDGDGYGDVIVGEPYFDGDVVDVGRARVYHGSSSGLGQNAAWSVTGDQRFALLGFAVATAGDVNGDGFSDVIVGARDHSNGEDREGRAWVHLGAPGGLSITADWFTESDDAFAEYGVSVSSAGDVNGDGFSDVLVGARLFDAPQNNEGRVSVFHGTPTGPSIMSTGVATGGQTGEEFGTWVASAGDVNGDGYDDVIVGAPFYNDGQVGEGRAVVFHGSPTGLAAQSWAVEGNQNQARMGISVAAAGDVNGDGYGDVIVAASGYDDPETDEGVAFVYHGSPTGLSTTPAWSAGSNQESAFLSAVGPAGDVNGDGYSDVIVGASLFDNGQTNAGLVLVFHGSAAGLLQNPSWVREGDQADARFGSAVWTAGDVNGDGYSDVIVGEPFASAPTFREGRALVYNGSAAGLADTASWFVESDQDNAGLGVAVGTAGDVNGDGFSDVIVGALRYDNGQIDEGAAFVYRGSAAGLSSIPSWIGEGDQANAAFGRSVSSAGDVNGDGFADVIVGARSFDNGQTDEGRAFLFFGNAGGGLAATPQQRRADDSAPIAQLGASDSFDSFRLALSGLSPFGRGRVKLEWEVKPLGQTLNGSALDRGQDWFDTGTTGPEVNERVEGLEQDPQYHWRVRFIYDPVTTPFQQRSRWFTVPVNGWQEGDLRMAGAPASPGAVPDGGDVPGTPLTLDRSGAQLFLEWGPSCVASDTGYLVYQGQLGQFQNPVPASGNCAARLETQATLPLPFTNAFYLVVPINGTNEGSYGTDSGGLERPASQSACLPQAIGVCE